ncbi:hypothetical protein CsatB_003388 [Cannabis sativa]
MLCYRKESRARYLNGRSHYIPLHPIKQYLNHSEEDREERSSTKEFQHQRFRERDPGSDLNNTLLQKGYKD